MNTCLNSLINVIKHHWRYVPSFRMIWKAVLMYQYCRDVAAWTLAQVNIIWVNIWLLSQPSSHRALIYLKARTPCKNFSTLGMDILVYVCLCLCVWIDALGSVKIHFISIQILQNLNVDAFENYLLMIFLICNLLLDNPTNVFVSKGFWMYIESLFIRLLAKFECSRIKINLSFHNFTV